MAVPDSIVERMARGIARQAHIDDGYTDPGLTAFAPWMNHKKQAQAALTHDPRLPPG